MKPFSEPGKTSAGRARNAALLNLLATPGLGSLLAGRWLAGTGQLVLALAGFTLIMVWFFRIIIPYYSMMFGDTPPPPIRWSTGVAGAWFFAVAWFWSLATSISLHRHASAEKLESLQMFKSGLIKLDAAGIERALSTVPQWRCHEAVISRTYEFKDFPAAMRFVNQVAALAEQAQHHPDMDVRWNKVTLALTTHDSGGLTEKDFALARACDGQAARVL